MTQVHLHAKDIAEVTGQTLVVFSKASAQKDKAAKITHAETAKALAETIEDKIVTGTASEAISFREARFLGFRHVICIGLGAENKMTAETVRQAGAALAKEIKNLKTSEAFVHFDGLTASKKEATDFMRAFVEGIQLCSYSFDELKTTDHKKKNDTQIHIVVKAGKDKAIAQAFNEGTVVAACANFAKRLGDMPGNLMTPTILANEAIAAAKGTSLKITAWDKKRIEKEKMGGLLGVAAGSAEEPRFIVMEYFGAAKTKKPIAARNIIFSFVYLIKKI